MKVHSVQTDFLWYKKFALLKTLSLQFVDFAHFCSKNIIKSNGRNVNSQTKKENGRHIATKLRIRSVKTGLIEFC